MPSNELRTISYNICENPSFSMEEASERGSFYSKLTVLWDSSESQTSSLNW